MSLKHILKPNGEIVSISASGNDWLGLWAKENRQHNKIGERTFRITKETYRIIAGASKEMFLKRKNNITFWTLTSPEYVNHAKFNIVLSKFFENLKRIYGLVSYIATAEYQKRGVIHYHMLFDMPFVSIARLNRYLVRLGNNNSIRFENNSLRLPPNGAIVQTSESVTNYICKYMSKSDVIGTIYNAKCYFISHNLIRKDIVLTNTEFEEIGRKGLFVGQKNGDYTKTTYIKRSVDIYNVFRVRRKKAQKELQRQRDYLNWLDDLVLQHNTKTMHIDFGDKVSEYVAQLDKKYFDSLTAKKTMLELLEKYRVEEKFNDRLASYEEYKRRKIERIDDKPKQPKIRDSVFELVERKNIVYKKEYDRKTHRFIKISEWRKKEYAKKWVVDANLQLAFS